LHMHSRKVYLLANFKCSNASTSVPVAYLTTSARHAIVQLFFESLLGVFRIRPRFGRFGCVPRMMLGLVKNASKHYMANLTSSTSSLSSKLLRPRCRTSTSADAC